MWSTKTDGISLNRPDPINERATDPAVIEDISQVRTHLRDKRKERDMRYLVWTFFNGATRNKMPRDEMVIFHEMCRTLGDAEMSRDDLHKQLKGLADVHVTECRRPRYKPLDGIDEPYATDAENISYHQEGVQKVWSSFVEASKQRHDAFEERVKDESFKLRAKREMEWGPHYNLPCQEMVEDGVDEHGVVKRRICGVLFQDHDTFTVPIGAPGKHMYKHPFYCQYRRIQLDASDPQSARRMCGIPLEKHSPEEVKDHAFAHPDIIFDYEQYMQVMPHVRARQEALLRGTQPPIPPHQIPVADLHFIQQVEGTDRKAERDIPLGAQKAPPEDAEEEETINGIPVSRLIAAATPAESAPEEAVVINYEDVDD